MAAPADKRDPPQPDANLARGCVKAASNCTAPGYRRFSWTSVDSVQHAGLRPLRFIDWHTLYEPDWAWALYFHKGACGVGQKAFPHYYAWMVRDAA